MNSRFMPCSSWETFGIDLAVGPFQVRVGDHARRAVARPGDVDHVQIVLLDDAVEVDVDEVQPGRGAPVAQQPRLDVLAAQRLLQQRIVVEIDLADGQVVGRPPVGVHLSQQIGGKRLVHERAPVETLNLKL